MNSSKDYPKYRIKYKQDSVINIWDKKRKTWDVFFPQIKPRWWSRWYTLNRWWCNYGGMELAGQKVEMFRGYVMKFYSHASGCLTKQNAQEHIDDAKKKWVLLLFK